MKTKMNFRKLLSLVLSLVLCLSLTNYAFAADGDETETKREITITANSSSKVYDGAALIDDGWTLEGELADGDEIVSVTVTGEQTAVGSSENVPSNAIIRNSVQEDVTDNYSISYFSEKRNEFFINSCRITGAVYSCHDIYLFFKYKYIKCLYICIRLSTISADCELHLSQ